MYRRSRRVWLWSRGRGQRSGGRGQREEEGGGLRGGVERGERSPIIAVREVSVEVLKRL
jgi:hypothetical protein